MKTQRWVLLLLILLAFARGAWALGEKSFWWDESLSLYRARQDIAGVLSNQTVLTDNTQEVVTVDNHPPLYFLLLWAVLRLAGRSEFALRFPSLAFAVLTVPLLYLVGRRLAGRAAGLLAAALGAVSPMYLWYGQEARGYTMLAFLGLLSFYLFVRAFLSLPGRRAAGWIAFYLIVSVALVLTHYLGVLLLGYELLVLALILIRRRRGRLAAVVSIAVLLAAMGASLAYVWFNRPDATAKVGFKFVPLLNLLRDLLNSFSLGLSVDVAYWPVVVLDLLFLMVLIVGLVWVVRRAAPAAQRRLGWLLAGYLMVPIVLTYLLSYVRPVYMNSRHLILVTPAFYLLVGAGLAALLGRFAARPATAARRAFPPALGLASYALPALLLAGIVYSTYNYFADPAYDKDHHRDWGTYVRGHVRPGDVVIVDPPCIAELYDYYVQSDAPWVGLPLLTGPRQKTVDKLMELIGTYDRVWLAFSHTPPWCDPRRFPEKWLNEHAFRVDYQEFESYASVVLVAAYVARRPAVLDLPNGSLPVEARISPQLRLVGYRPVSAAQSGRPFHVELFWAVDAPPEQEASVVLRLVGPAGNPDGHVWGQGEQCPFNGLYPMWQWQPGVTLQDEHMLTIQPGTPPGRYELEAMLVSRPSDKGCLGERGAALVPVAGSTVRGDRVLLGEVEVTAADRPPALDALDIEHRRHAAVGNGLVLLGEQVVPADLRGGDPLDVTLYWESEQAALPDLRFRLQLLDESGTTREETIIRPAGNTYPADRWQAGDRVKGQFRLWLPEDAPAGRYTLWLTPDPPLKDAGVVATVRRWLSCVAGACGPGGAVHLGRVRVAASGEEGVTALPAPPADLPAAHRVKAAIDAQVRLLGYDLSAGTIRAGETISLTLYWQGLRPMAQSYHVFTHLAGPSGQAVAQKDGVPRGGAYPTNLWQPGELIVDHYQITVDPATAPGTYPLEVGMYRLETLKRLPMIDDFGRRLEGDRLVLAEVTVLPAPTPTPLPPTQKRYLPLITKH